MQFDQCCWGIGSGVGWVWGSEVGFGGCCELTWVWGCFTAPIWTSPAWRDEVKQRQAHSQHGTILASHSSPPQSPHWDLRQQVKVQGTRDLGFIAHLCLGLGDRWGAWGKRDLLTLTDCTGRQWPSYFKIMFPHAVQNPAACRLFCAAALLPQSTGIYLCWAQQGQATTSPRVGLELSLGGGGGDAFACLLQPSKWKCWNEFLCWALTGARKSRKFSKNRNCLQLSTLR